MKTCKVIFVSSLSFAFLLSGCVVRTYKTTRDRIDQELVGGNRGYIMGKAPSSLLSEERKPTRSTQVVEVELRSPIKFGKKSKMKPEQPIQQAEVDSGNGGYISESASVEPATALAEQGLGKYTVQKNDTLQKISQKLFGTTKKWTKIYDLNKNVLSAPNKIYPGQVLNVPAAAVKEAEENLK